MSYSKKENFFFHFFHLLSQDLQIAVTYIKSWDCKHFEVEGEIFDSLKVI